MIRANKSIKILYAVIALLVIIAAVFAMAMMKNTPNINGSVASVRLNIETYLDGKNQPTHPSVISFSEPWNGYRYWMAYTPYPYANGSEENPSICASNDMLYWETPEGLANPIATNEETECTELKDSHLLYRDDLDRIEVWYLGRLSERLGGDGMSLTLFRKYSYDGKTWSNYEVMAAMECVSPSVLWDGTKYQLWSIDYDGQNTSSTLTYWESADGFLWSAPQLCSLGGNPDEAIWHGSVSVGPNGYDFVYILRDGMQEVMYCTSVDGIHFSEPAPILENTKEKWNKFYRPAMVWDNGTCYCLYGVINDANQWYISMSYGEDPCELVGLTEADVPSMFPLPNDVTATDSIIYKIKEVMHVLRYYFRLELLGIVAIEFFLLCMKPVRKLRIWDTFVPYVAHFLLVSLYTGMLMQVTKVQEWIYVLLASVITGFLISASADAIRMRLNKYFVC